MLINIKNKEVELKFTYNSFKFMEEFDISMLQDIESKPFKMIRVVEHLLLGAVNNNPKVVFTGQDISKYVADSIDEGGNISELLEELMKALEDSSFFKSLQKK